MACLCRLKGNGWVGCVSKGNDVLDGSRLEGEARLVSSAILVAQKLQQMLMTNLQNVCDTPYH